MSRFKFPPVAFAFGVPKKLGKPFNRSAICKIAAWWEEQTRTKLHLKILPVKLAGYEAYFDHRNVYLSDSTPALLFHELQHLKQQQRGLYMQRFTHNWILRYFKNNKIADSYFSSPVEREANRVSKQLTHKFYEV